MLCIGQCALKALAHWQPSACIVTTKEIGSVYVALP